MKHQRIQQPMLVQAAPISTVDAEARTIEVVFTTGERIHHLMWTDDGLRRVPTEVVVTEQAAELEKLNRNGPVLDGHMQWESRNVIGSVQQAWIENGQGKAILKFSEADDVEPIWQRVRDGSLRACSMGFVVHSIEIDDLGEDTEVWRFTRWEPREISMVPIGADSGAMTQSGETGRFPAEIRHRSKERQMPDDSIKDPAAKPDTTPPAAAGPETAQQAIDKEALRKQAAADERARIAEIRQAAEALSVADAVVQSAIDDGVSVDAFRKQAIDAYAERGRKETENIGTPRAEVTADARDRFVQGATEGVMARAGVKGGARNEFSGMTLPELARHSISLTDPKATFSDRRQMVGQAFVMQGAGHSTSDFAQILANVANKAALMGWEEAEETFERWTRTGSLPDFKPAKRVGLGLLESLTEVPEGAKYKYGTVSDRAETITLATYGKIVKITRQAVINDDLDMLGDTPRKMGRAAKRTIGNLVYAVLTGNPNMSDGTALFHADHNNLASSGAAPSVASFGAARAAMRTQKESAGGPSLNIRPRYVIAPAALETSISQLLNSTVDPAAQKGHASNPVANMAELIVDGRLDDSSATAWFLAADPSAFDTIEVAYLDGNEEPYLEEKLGWSVDGVELKVRMDAGVAPLEYRTLYKNPGA